MSTQSTVNKFSILSAMKGAQDQLSELKKAAVREGIPADQQFGKYTDEANGLSNVFAVCAIALNQELVSATQLVAVHGRMPEDEFTQYAKTLQAGLMEFVNQEVVDTLESYGVKLIANPSFEG